MQFWKRLRKVFQNVIDNKIHTTFIKPSKFSGYRL